MAVTPDGRGFPPDIAKRKLAKLCGASEEPHTSDPAYRAGVEVIHIQEIDAYVYTIPEQ